MKKLMFIAVAFIAIATASCSSKDAKAAAALEDTTEVAVDSLANDTVDTITVDSAEVATEVAE